MDWLDQQRSEITSISKAGEDQGIWLELGDIKQRVQEVDRQISSKVGPEWDQVRGSLQSVPGSIARIEERLRSLRELGSTVRMRARDLRGTPSERELGRLARRCGTTLQAVAKALDGTPETEPQPSASCWGLYRSAEQLCRTLFAEYVELLGGLALRDAGFDADLCHIADELVKVLETGSQLLTIPAGSERQGESPAQLIRIGFPDWSIWALPLVAHEFGHIFLRAELGRDFDDDSVDAASRLCMADAFATLTLGPAFAASAFLMRLEPSSCTTTDPLVARRAAAIRASLAKLDALDPAVRPLAGLTRDLAQHWSDSVAAAVDPAHAGAAFDDTGADDLVELVYDALPAGMSLPVKEWGTIEDWSRCPRQRDDDRASWCARPALRAQRGVGGPPRRQPRRRRPRRSHAGAVQGAARPGDHDRRRSPEQRGERRAVAAGDAVDALARRAQGQLLVPLGSFR